MSEQTEEEKAFEAARAEIRHVRETRETRLDLWFDDYSALTQLPEDIETLKQLTKLDLGGTQITDAALPQIAKLTQLTALYLSGTQITDAALLQIAKLTNLFALGLNNTQITDAALPQIAQLTQLTTLNLIRTQITDLRPLKNMPKLSQLWFDNIPALDIDPELRRLSEILDDKERTGETLAYLRSLPEDDMPEPPAPNTVDVPSNNPAPLMVIERDGMLQPITPKDDLDDQGRQMAKQAWTALREFLDDLAPTRARIHNGIPQLDRALTRLDHALSEHFDQFNPISFGIHAQRVIRQSQTAGDVLMDADAAEVAEFAAALALYLEQFPSWLRYKSVPSPLISRDVVEDALPDVDDLAEILDTPDAIAPDIPASLADQSEGLRADPENPIAIRGLRDSISNVMSPLATSILKVCKNEALDVGKSVWSKVKGVTASGVAGAALDIFATKGATLRLIAQKLEIDWLLKFLTTIGL